jgi:hypothetical protein
MQFSKIVYSNLTNNKKQLKKFLEYMDANNSYKLMAVIKNKMINRSSSRRLATHRKLTKILEICILINKKRINVVSFIEINLNEFIKLFFC